MRAEGFKAAGRTKDVPCAPIRSLSFAHAPRQSNLWKRTKQYLSFAPLTGCLLLFSSSKQYSQGIERAVLSGPAALETSSAPGLNFGQFVDALARCGLLCPSSKCIDGTRTLGGGFGGGVGNAPNKSQLLSTAERVQAIFIARMRLLDSQHVDARLQPLVRLPCANPEGEAPEEGNKLESIRQRKNRGHAAGSGPGGKKKGRGGHTARGTNAVGPRGGNRKATDSTPATALAPIQITPRGLGQKRVVPESNY